MKQIRWLLAPLAILYGLVTWIRNLCFDLGIFRGHRFDIPLICVGNLSTGGTGKTPHVEYILRLLRQNFRVATLSRGYGRKTRGFRLATADDDSFSIGDESMQYVSKFETVAVAVCEDRVKGVTQLLDLIFDLECVVLDDGFQHRRLKPGLSIILTDYYKLYCNDFPLPAGNLREFTSSAKRADIIIVTKSPKVLSPITRRNIEDQLKLKEHQKLYFSYIKYGQPIPLTDAALPHPGTAFTAAVLFAGIANTYPLEAHLSHLCGELQTLRYSDHHNFTEADISKIITTFDAVFSKNKALFTTEKDLMRLQAAGFIAKFGNIPFFYVPIQAEFHGNDKNLFNTQIIDYVRKD